MAIEVAITNEQKVNITVNPVTASGIPAKLDGAPTWTVNSGTSTVEPAADGLSAFLVSGVDAGDTVYTVEGDADLGEGVVNISDTITLHVEAAQAADLGLAAGAAEPK